MNKGLTIALLTVVVAGGLILLANQNANTIIENEMMGTEEQVILMEAQEAEVIETISETSPETDLEAIEADLDFDLDASLSALELE